MSLADIKDVLADTSLTEAESTAKAQALLDEIENEASRKAAKEAEGTSASLMSMFTAQSPAAKDPVQVMREVLADTRYSPEQKNLLFFMSRERFQNRRKMAYVALIVLVSTAVFLGLGMILDVFRHSSVVAACVSGLENIPSSLSPQERATAIAALASEGCVQYPFSSVLKANSEILTWLGTFFTSIIALYFGAASFRPTS